MKRIKQFSRLPFKNIRNRFSSPMPSDPQHNDLYIVAYPKSGLNWLCCILANIALIESKRVQVANFVSSRLYVPIATPGRRIGNQICPTPPVRMMRTHSARDEQIKNVVYLVRHPLSVLQSYYRYMRHRSLDRSVSFDDFCRSKRFGAAAWNAHIQSWLRTPDRGDILHLVRYEDLSKSAQSQIAALSENFGWSIRDSTIEQAVERSSVQEMKASEEISRKWNPRYSGVFVKEKSNPNVSDETLAYIDDICADSITLLGYQ